MVSFTYGNDDNLVIDVYSNGVVCSCYCFKQTGKWILSSDEVAHLTDLLTKGLFDDAFEYLEK